MTEPPSKATLLARAGTLAIIRDPRPGAAPTSAADIPDDIAEIFVLLADDGAITAFNGHVDLGTGIRTALAQIVAEELDVAFERVTMVLGDTARAPNQGATIASDTIQVSAIPLRHAAAQARQFLLGLAAAELGVPAADLAVEDGVVVALHGDNRRIAYGELVAGRRDRLVLAATVPLKPVDSYRVVGQPVARTDIPAKASGAFAYVHDMRLPGMLHGRVVRPPYAGRDSGEFVGTSLIRVDETSIAHIPGIIAVVVIRDFVGVVAMREEHADKAARELKVEWRDPPDLPDLGDVATALRANPSTPRTLLRKGDVDAAIAGAARPMPRTYVWPWQMHGSIGPSCSLADWRGGSLTLWSGTQNPHVLRADIARLMEMPEPAVEVVRMEAAGCYGRNCADDVGGDAALLSRAVGRPVRVQLTREQEHQWEPKGAAQLMDVNGGLDGAGHAVGYDFVTRYPSNGAPLLALVLTGMVPPVAEVFQMGDRTAIPPYDYDAMRIVVHDMPPILRASWLRGVSALPNSFAHESYIDELATEAGVDPIEYRLRYLKDPRAVDLVKAVAVKADWVPHTQPQTMPSDGDMLYGRGFAYALYVHSQFPGYGAAWSAWVADVAVNRTTGEVNVTRVVVGQDSGLMINPAGIVHQIHGNVIQSASRVLCEEVTTDRREVVAREWGAYPILTFPQVPAIDVVLMPRPHEPPLGGGESASVPSAAAIANAIFDATGVRFRELPFTPDKVRAALDAHGLLSSPATGVAGREGDPFAGASRRGFPSLRPSAFAGDDRRASRPRRSLVGLAALAAAGLAAAFAILAPGPRAFAPIARPDPAVFSAATIERGRALAGLGGCATCHTAPGGLANAGGLAIETPFGTVVSTNITPDPETGIGAWSYPAFERAMREGIHRDGRRLYPAFPYPSFTKAGDADLEALYAFLMAGPAIRAETPPSRLRFPFGLRSLMAAWNSLFLKSGALVADPAQTDQWNRGAALVEGIGHCGACHTPRNALGAEEQGADHLAGGTIEGWDAPALTALSDAPIPWTEDELFAYLRTGHSPFHGVAAGPMAPVVKALAPMPDQDIRAMAVYLASFQTSCPGAAEQQAQAAALNLRPAPVSANGRGATLYAGACAVCHAADAPPLFGVKVALGLTTSLHAATPDNLVRVMLEGIADPAHADLGIMPSFRDQLDDRQVADLVAYLRQGFAPDRPAWTDVGASVARIRASPTSH